MGDRAATAMASDGEVFMSSVDMMKAEREERRLRMKRQRESEEERTGKVAKIFNEPPKPVDRLRNVGPLPEGWLDCPGAGDPIANLIPSKVPLGETFNELLDAGRRYSRRHVVRHQTALGRKIGLVIDLTNTSRYYNSNEWTNDGVKYVKVACRGRNEVPDPESVNTFVFEVMRFFSNLHAKGDNGGNKYILVHCTHGHNRTGFMIVHYLMRTQYTSVEQAIRMFAKARPPGIYKQHYIEDLYKFYHEPKPQNLVCPSTPEWKRPETPDLNCIATTDQDEDDEDDFMAALQFKEDEPAAPIAAMTNDDVLGDAIPDDQQREMQKLCYWAVGVPPPQGYGMNNLRFPGSQPVSLDRKNLQLLRQKYYYATWKADGTRYMMLIARDGVYLIDRNFKFRRVQLRFPIKGQISKDALAPTHHLTLMDGEMVIDKLPDGQLKRRYLVYDLMMINQKPLSKLPFHERWRMIEKEVVEPRAHELNALRRGLYEYQLEAFSVRRKDFWMLSTTDKILHKFIPQLCHEADGLILQGWDDPYVPRTHEGLLKWKYAHMNSVDFLLKIEPGANQYLLMLMDSGKLRKLDNAKVVFPEDADIPNMANKVIECSYDPELETWSYMRMRPDKDTPNAYHVYLKVMGSIKDNITEEDLQNEFQDILRLPLYTERIARDQQAAHHALHARRK